MFYEPKSHYLMYNNLIKFLLVCNFFRIAREDPNFLESVVLGARGCWYPLLPFEDCYAALGEFSSGESAFPGVVFIP